MRLRTDSGRGHRDHSWFSRFTISGRAPAQLDDGHPQRACVISRSRLDRRGLEPTINDKRAEGVAADRHHRDEEGKPGGLVAIDNPRESRMRSVMQAYIDGFNSALGESLAALFADHARIEDPVGGAVIVEGRAAIDEFYRRAVEVVDRLELVAPIRTSQSNFAAMAFDIHLRFDGKPTCIRAIDVMEFDDTGKIIGMKAFHGPGDVVTGVADTSG